jgi:hypothetical protein
MPITDTSVPFSGTISANNGTGCYTTATYNISDNGSVAAITISATGLTTANGNFFEEGGGSGVIWRFKPNHMMCAMTAFKTSQHFGASYTSSALSDATFF